MLFFRRIFYDLIWEILDFFFLPAESVQKRKENGYKLLFIKNMETIFSYLYEIALKKKKVS